MAGSWECRVSQMGKGHRDIGTGDLLEGPAMASCTSGSELEHLLLLFTSHLDPACPGEGLILVRSCSRKRNGSPRVSRRHPCSSTDVPWASPCRMGLPCFLPVPSGACCRLAPAQPASHAYLDMCHADSFHQMPQEIPVTFPVPPCTAGVKDAAGVSSLLSRASAGL